MLCAASQVFAMPPEEHKHDEHDGTQETNEVAGAVCPKVDQKRDMSVSRDAVCKRAKEEYPTIGSGNPADKSSENGNCERDNGQWTSESRVAKGCEVHVEAIDRHGKQRPAECQAKRQPTKLL